METIPEYDYQANEKQGQGKPPWQRDRFEGLRSAAVWLGLIAGLGAVAWFCITMLTQSTEPRAAYKVMKEELSPDGARRAAVVLQAGKATPVTGVLIQDGRSKIVPNLRKTYVFAMTFELPLRIRWDGPNQLTIVYPSDADNADELLKLEEFEGIRVRYVGEPMFTPPAAQATGANTEATTATVAATAAATTATAAAPRP